MQLTITRCYSAQSDYTVLQSCPLTLKVTKLNCAHTIFHCDVGHAGVHQMKVMTYLSVFLKLRKPVMA